MKDPGPKYPRPADLLFPFRMIVAIMFVIVVAVTLAQIVMRYAFNDPLIWSEELARFLIVWVTFIGAGVVCYDGRHLNVDVLFTRLPEKAKAAIRLLNQALAIGFLAVLGWTSITLVRIESTQELSALPLSLGAVRLAVTIGAVLAILAILLRRFQLWPAMRGTTPDFGENDPL